MPLHTLLETLAVTVALMIYAIGWNTRHFQRSPAVRWISVLFLGVGALDFLHVISYAGMPDFVTHSGAEKAIYFWLMARAMAGLGLLGMAAIPLLSLRSSSLPARGLMVAVIGLTGLSGWLVLFHSQWLPAVFVPEQGLTTLKRVAEYGLMLLYLASAWLFYLQAQRSEYQDSIAIRLFSAAVIMALSEHFFTLYSNVTDLYNLLGHLFKIIAYWVLYQALFVDTVTRPYRHLFESEQKWRSTVQALPDLLCELDASGNLLYFHAGPEKEHHPLARMIREHGPVEALPTSAIRVISNAMSEAREYGVSQGHLIQVELGELSCHFAVTVSRLSYDCNDDQEQFLLLLRDETSMVQHQQDLAYEARLNMILLSLSQKAQHQREDHFLQFCCEQIQFLTGSEAVCLQITDGDRRFVSTLGSCPGEMPDWPTAINEPFIGNSLTEIRQALGESVLSREVTRLICVPLIENQQVYMRVCALNKELPYDQRDREDLQILVEAIWRQLQARRMQGHIETLSFAIAQGPHSVIISDVQGRIQYVNAAFEKSTGYQLDEVIGKTPGMLRSGLELDNVYQDLWQHLKQGESWSGELSNRRKDGSVYNERLTVYPVYNSARDLVNYISHGEDLTNEQQAANRIQQLSHYDQLTELPNRLLLEERFLIVVDHSRQYNEALALVSIDIDNFKEINDSLGHSAGDFLLQKVASRLAHQMGSRDSIARLSGDNFIVLLNCADHHKAGSRAIELLQGIDQPVWMNDIELNVTASAGIALYPDDGQTLEALMMCAEAAMYQAKQNGKNTYRFFSPDMHAQASRSLYLANALKHARERDQLYLTYQPQANLKTGKLVGAEVLLRWQHPEMGLISPAEFIPLAETNGLILPITDWVLRTACRQLKIWQQQGMPELVLAVNISAVQFSRPGLRDSLLRVLSEEGIEPRHIEVELTEVVALADPEGAMQTMTELKEAGFHLAIDDFGTGYSSMSYLKRFDVDKLKIDQSFIRDLESSRDDQAIVQAISQIADTLGMTSIAEGVETPEQLQLLKNSGCKQLQGFHYSKPLTAEDFAAFVFSKPKLDSGF
nr:EAL domain-containing protein [Oceanobacter mangrovi]